MGTKELKELFSFGFALGKLVSGVLDGLSFDDVGKLIEVARKAGPGVDGAPLALAEYIAMTDAEALEFEQFVQSEFDIADDKLEQTIEQALKVLVELRSLVSLLVKP